MTAPDRTTPGPDRSPERAEDHPPRLRRLGPIPALDGVRGIAVLLVMMVHLQLLVPFEATGVRAVDGFIKGGYLGVDLFFVLSGFLITALLLGEADRRGAVRYGAFYLRRALRLLPALYVLLFAHVVYATIEGLPADVEFATVRAAVLYLSNWQVVLDPTSVAHELTHLWSLAIEEQFYLFWPVLVLTFFGPRRSARTVGLALGAAVVGVAVWRVWLLDHGTYWTELTVRTDTRVDALLIGALLASLWTRRATPVRGVGPAAWVGLGVLFACVATFRGPDDFGYRGGLTLYALAAAVVVLGLVDGRWRGRWLFELAPLRAVGRVSYGLYLWHYPIFYVVGVHGESLDDLTRVTTALALTSAATLGSWYVVERPALAMKARFGGSEAPDPDRPPPPTPAPVPLPGWSTEWGRTAWGLGATVVLLAAMVGLLGRDGAGPGGVGFPNGDADRTEYWGLVGLEATVIEDFDRPDAPSLTAAERVPAWAPVEGTWAIDGGRAAATPVEDGPSLAILRQPDVDGLTEVTLPRIAEGAGLVIRYAGPDDFWAVVAHPERGTWTLEQVRDGEVTATDEFEASVDDGTTVSVTQDGTTVRVLIDGVERLRVQDVAFAGVPAGGLVAMGPEAADARWDRYLVMRFGTGVATG